MATSFPTDALSPSTTSITCDDADYIHFMFQGRNHQLLTNQILASSNCEYFLRSEPDQLSLYLISSGSPELINQWELESNDTIWTIYSDLSQNEPQSLTLSNDGCLTWNIEAADVENPSSSILHRDAFCDTSKNASISNTASTNNNDAFFRPATTTNFFDLYTSTIDSDIYPIHIEEKVSFKSSMDNIDIIYISIGATFIFLIFGLLCFFTIYHAKNRASQAIYNRNSHKYINSGWEDGNGDDNNNGDSDLDLNYGARVRTAKELSGSDVAKGSYITQQSAVEYGLKVPIKYENHDMDTDDENNEIQENELGYFMNNSQESYDHEYNRSADLAHDAIMDLVNNTSNRTVRINLSDISDESTSSSDEAPEPEIEDLIEDKHRTPTKVDRGGEKRRNKWGKFNL